MQKRRLKKYAVVTTCYFLAALLVLGGMGLREHAMRISYERAARTETERAFLGLSESLRELSYSLQKCLYATSGGVLCSVCTDIFGSAASATSALSQLEYSGAELTNIASFINRTGDYVYALSKLGTLDTAALENLRSLSETADGLYESVAELRSGLMTGETELAALDEKIGGAGLGESFQLIESEFPSVPTLIYDGPFSQHIEKSAPKLLENLPDVGQPRALDEAAEFLGLESSTLSPLYSSEGKLPVYAFTAERGGYSSTVEVTKQGGVVLNVYSDRRAGTPMLSAEDAVGLAREFLSERGYGDMADSYWICGDGELTASFAAAQDGVVCYPDLVKVTVALDTGEIVGFEARGYVMSHTRRELPEAAVSEEQASERIAEGLTVLGSGLAVIPTDGMNEVFCREFVCESSDGRHVLVYVNAVTGEQEKLLLLIEDESGTLAI